MLNDEQLSDNLREENTIYLGSEISEGLEDQQSPEVMNPHIEIAT